MKKTIIIVESPGKVQSIQKYLGDKYIVCASNGQIVNLAKGGRYGIGVNPIDKFKTFYTLMPDKVYFLDKIISNADNIDKIIICTDPDTEGHGIAWHIAEKFKHLNKPIFRAEFHEITQEGIVEGLRQVSDIDINKFKAQETRRILDRLVGFMVSPFLINSYGANLSAGRVQSVATRMVIEREREISKFEPQEYWNINVNLTKDKQSFIAKYQGKVKSKEIADQIKLDIEQPNIADSLFQVLSVSKKPKKENSESPLTTAKMQQVMASKYGFEGERTMAAAQSLYESGYCTYIRTDSVRASDTALDNVREWLSNNKFEIPVKPNTFKNKDASQNAHECIRPTNLNNMPDTMNLANDTKLLYKTIWNYFVSSQMCPAVYDTLEAKIVHTILGKHQFKLTGKLLVSPGYLAILEDKVVSQETFPTIDSQDLLHLFDDKSISLEQKFTQPPARYNYGSLIKELETKGIGRPSTYTEIISKITSRHYVEKQGNTYHGTKLGDDITTVLTKYFDFMEYDYTAELEKQMDEISEGKLNNLTVLTDFYLRFQDKLKAAHLDHHGKMCDKCSAPMYLKNGKNDTKFWGCALFPFCNYSTSVELKNCA